MFVYRHMMKNEDRLWKLHFSFISGPTVGSRNSQARQSSSPASVTRQKRASEQSACVKNVREGKLKEKYQTWWLSKHVPWINILFTQFHSVKDWIYKIVKKKGGKGLYYFVTWTFIRPWCCFCVLQVVPIYIIVRDHAKHSFCWTYCRGITCNTCQMLYNVSSLLTPWCRWTRFSTCLPMRIFLMPIFHVST